MRPMVVGLIKPHGKDFPTRPMVMRLIELQVMAWTMITGAIRSNYKIPFPGKTKVATIIYGLVDPLP